MDIITQLSMLGLKEGASLDEWPAIRIEKLGELQAGEGHSLFLQQLLNLQTPTLPDEPVTAQQFIKQQELLLPQQFEKVVPVDLSGQYLPSGGKQLPLPQMFRPATTVEATHSSTVFSPLPLVGTVGHSTEIQIQDKSIDLQLSPARFQQALGNRVLWMVNQDIKAAELQINPPHLGPLKVHISLHGDQANVSFITQHAEVREIMESTLPRLREQLAEAGLGSTNVDVSQQDFSHARHNSRFFSTLTSTDVGTGDGSTQHDHFISLQGEKWLGQEMGLIDYFA